MEEPRTKITRQIFAAITGTIIVMAAGFHAGWTSPTLPKLLKDTSIPVTVDQSSWIATVIMIGSMCGPFLSAATVDRCGRKPSMLLTAVLFSISSILTGFAQNYWYYFVARFLSGLGYGAVYAVVPMYLGEISEDRIRGGIGILLSAMSHLGTLIPYCIGPWISIRALAAVGAVIPIVYIFTFTWMPETPYYYTMKDKPDNARKSLEWLRGTENVDEEIDIVKKTVAFDLENKGTLKELVTHKGNRKALIIVLGLYSGQQITGIVAIVNYSTIIFDEVTSDISSAVSVIILGIVQLVVTMVTVFVADKAGRRTLLLISMFFTTVFLIGEAVYFQLKANAFDVIGISWLPVTALVGYLCSYNLGMGTVSLAIVSELFPCNVKAYAITICTAYLSFIATIVSLSYPMVSNAYGIHFAFYGFAAGSALFFGFIFCYLPETRGRSFGDIQQILQGHSGSKSNSPKVNKR